jgi:NADH-quinone oxidoreductase subunit H
MTIFYIFEIFFLTLAIILPLLITVAFFTLSERKLMASIQRRVGPNVVGVYGLLQPLADGLKLILKETIIPSRSERILFIAAPGYTFFLSLIP